MDYIITYKFKDGTEKKVKSKVSSILKNTYEKKKLLIRLGYGRLFIDTKFISNEIKEKLEKNNAIVKIEELEELPRSIKANLKGITRKTEISEERLEQFDELRKQNQNFKNNLEIIKKSLLNYDELFKKIAVTDTHNEVISLIMNFDSTFIDKGIKIAKEEA